jgi:hypothetical protein
MPLPTYLGYDVLDWMPAWSAVTPNWQYSHKKNRWDNLISTIRDDKLYSLSPRTRRTLRFIIEGEQNIEDVRNFILQVAQGRLKPFWVPSWIHDLPLVAPCAAIEDILTVRPFGYDPYLNGAQIGRQHVALYPWNASPSAIIYRKIINESVNIDGDEELTLDSALGVDLEVHEMVSWLMLCRADSDDLTIQWENSSLVTFELSIIDLAMETP